MRFNSFEKPSIPKLCFNFATNNGLKLISYIFSPLKVAFRFSLKLMQYETSLVGKEEDNVIKTLSSTERNIAGGIVGAVKGASTALLLGNGVSLPVLALLSIGLLPNKILKKLGKMFFGFEILYGVQHFSAYSLAIINRFVPIRFYQIGTKYAFNYCISISGSRRLRNISDNLHLPERIWLWMGVVTGIYQDYSTVYKTEKFSISYKLQTIGRESTIKETMQCDYGILTKNCRIEKEIYTFSEAYSQHQKYINGNTIVDEIRYHLPAPKLEKISNAISKSYTQPNINFNNDYFSWTHTTLLCLGSIALSRHINSKLANLKLLEKLSLTTAYLLFKEFKAVSAAPANNECDSNKMNDDLHQTEDHEIVDTTKIFEQEQQNFAAMMMKKLDNIKRLESQKVEALNEEDLKITQELILDCLYNIRRIFSFFGVSESQVAINELIKDLQIEGIDAFHYIKSVFERSQKIYSIGIQAFRYFTMANTYMLYIKQYKILQGNAFKTVADGELYKWYKVAWFDPSPNFFKTIRKNIEHLICQDAVWTVVTGIRTAGYIDFGVVNDELPSPNEETRAATRLELAERVYPIMGLFNMFKGFKIENVQAADPNIEIIIPTFRYEKTGPDILPTIYRKSEAAQFGITDSNDHEIFNTPTDHIIGLKERETRMVGEMMGIAAPYIEDYLKRFENKIKRVFVKCGSGHMYFAYDERRTEFKNMRSAPSHDPSAPDHDTDNRNEAYVYPISPLCQFVYGVFHHWKNMSPTHVIDCNAQRGKQDPLARKRDGT